MPTNPSRILMHLSTAVFVAACATPGGETRPLARSEPAPAVVATGASAEATTAAAAVVKTRGSGAAQSGEPIDLAIWSDPAFQRQFAESFLAESDVEPRVTVVERDRLQEVMEMIGADQVDEAIAQLEGMRGEAASALVDYLLANLYTRGDRIDDAAASYSAAIAKYPKFRRAWKNYGSLRLRKGEYAAAATALARVVELGGNDAITFGLLGYCHVELSNFVAAESAYRMATMLDPGSLNWQIGLARSLFKTQRHADAVALCSALVDRYPDRADLWMHLANANLGLGQTLRAAECYEMVARLGKATADSQLKLGDIYSHAEIYDQAVAAYEQGLRMDANVPTDRPLLAARVMAARGARGEARRLLASIDAVRGDHLTPATKKEMLHLSARIALAEGAGDEEVRVLEQIVAMDPLDGDALILLGQHHATQGDIEHAVACFERAAGIEAFEPDALVQHGRLLVKQGKYGEALQLLRRAQTIRPRDSIQEYLERVERFAQGRS